MGGENTILRAREQVYCAMCREELYPGDHYFLLEGQRVCERCLGRYAQRYFANERRPLRVMYRETRSVARHLEGYYARIDPDKRREKR